MSEIVKWKPVTEDRYMEMLEILPPAYWGKHGFLVGEPWTHDSRGNPMFQPFIERVASGAFEYFEADQPLTIKQFRTLNPSTIVVEG